MKTSKYIIIFQFACLGVFLVACKDASLITAATRSPKPPIELAQLTTVPVTASASPQLTETPLLVLNTPHPNQLVLSENDSPIFITPKDAFPKKSGVYLVYIEQENRIQYISVDGSERGDILSYTFVGNRPPKVFMSSTAQTPKLIFANYDIGDNKIPKDGFNIWTVDLLGNFSRNWHVKAGSDMDCKQPSFSPSGQWMAMLCSTSFGHYLNLLNIELGEQKTISLPSDAIDIQPENWSQDEMHLFVWADHKTHEYFVSLSENTIIQSSIKLMSVSPDWNKIIFPNGDMPHKSDGTIPGIKIAVADLKCMLEKPDCTQKTEINLPFYQNIDEKIFALSWTNWSWDASGKNPVWLNIACIVPYGGVTCDGFSSGLIDLKSNTNQVIWQGIWTDRELLSRSPDGEWLLFSDRHGLYIGSIKQKTIHLLVDKSQHWASFYGWLIIP